MPPATSAQGIRRGSTGPPALDLAVGDDADGDSGSRLGDARGAVGADGGFAGSLDAQAAGVVGVDELRPAAAEAFVTGVDLLSARVGPRTGLEDYSEGGLAGFGNAVTQFTSIHPLSRVWH